MSILLDDNSPILVPKYHAARSTLFWKNLHVGKSVKRFLPRYELRFDCDFDLIVDKCVTVHGNDWLTKQLTSVIKLLHKTANTKTRPASFGVYRNGELKAGEFGIISGRVYTSYSGYFEENSAGRAQMILTALFLRDHAFDFWDLGMPLPYKYTIGAIDINAVEWTRRFRTAQWGVKVGAE
jgi:Leu/Phe-tRNA-protein transferase